MFKKKTLLGIVFFLIFLILYSPFLIRHSNAQSGFTFSRNLRIGDSGEDVRELQKILNSDDKTTVAQIGPGSRGEESNYFGRLTLNAVIRFQNLYKYEIVGNNPSFVGTGYVGPLTRKKLNSFTLLNSSEGTPAKQDLTGQASNLTTPFLEPPQILNLSRLEASPGQIVDITGLNFTKSNAVYLNDKKIAENLTSADGVHLSLAIPIETEFGQYNLWIENERGNSRSQISGNFFTVTSNPRNPPSFDQKEISVGSPDETFILSGENFGTKNDVWSSLGNIQNVYSDGRSISLKLGDFPKFADLAKAFKYLKGQSIDLYFFVKTEAGVTASPQKVILRIN